MLCTAKSALLGTQKRKITRPISPKSPVASASVFDSVEEESDDDDDDDTVGHTTCLHTNGDVVSCCLAVI
jgi:AMP deaminase